MSQFEYDGLLSTDSARYIQKYIDKGYMHWVSVKPLPNLYPWSETNMIQDTVCTEDCMGNDVSMKRPSYVVIQKELIGFKHLVDRNAFIKDFREYVVSQNPITTKTEYKDSIEELLNAINNLVVNHPILDLDERILRAQKLIGVK